MPSEPGALSGLICLTAFRISSSVTSLVNKSLSAFEMSGGKGIAWVGVQERSDLNLFSNSLVMTWVIPG